jgi:hypothetical protein
VSVVNFRIDSEPEVERTTRKLQRRNRTFANWTKSQNDMLNVAFKANILEERAPKKTEIDSFLNSANFKEISWKQIKIKSGTRVNQRKRRLMTFELLRWKLM